MDRLACVNFPAFPLQLLLRGHPEWTAYPVAVVAEDKPQSAILWVNRKALQARVLPGLRYASGASLAPDLRAGTISSTEVEREIALLAKWFTRFTPDVEPSKEEPGVFWLSGTGLNLLYPSIKEWAHAVYAAVKVQGFRAKVAAGFTRFGTYAAAKQKEEIAILENISQERSAARKTSLDHLGLDPELRDALFKLGINTVAAFLRLPPGGLYERFGRKAYRLYRMASADLWEPLQPYEPEEPVRQGQVLDGPEIDSARLLFFIKRHLHPMMAALAHRSEALTELLLRFLIYRTGWREERVRPAAPTLDSVQVLDLVRLRLEMMQFSAGVVEIELTAKGIPATTEQLRLFAERPERDLDAANRALARLRAEFGDEAVVRAQLTDGHLPEARFTWQPLDQVQLPNLYVEASRSSATKQMGLFQQATRILVRRILAKPVPLPSPPRTPHNDGWLVLGSQCGVVERLSGPYILSGGWWNREIHREYYFAETRRGCLSWIYYDRVRRKWFLQGWVE
jgi:protein ImuB